MDPPAPVPFDANAPSIETVDGELFETERARKICRRMFYFGFAFLPWLWFTNVWLFWFDFIGRPGADPALKKYTRRSAVGFVVTTVAFLPWFLLYITAGQKVLDPDVYRTLDATRLNVKALGLPTS